ncbi:hypothetical protein MHY85_03135 [Cellulomonas sp. ACRRI]|uniref:hypothetical protein n=1 Tax=Cellulomonas sp. ACRRI TaxID=2918188 RepID=UPI001EF39250|nr:hypothetical protein [Cellulomonas sp. ACRRI]MCG7284966.1 hypothetical protein [Cellulomonas sp. ACRRI]
MGLPTPYTVVRLPYIPGTTNAHGNPVDTWGAPATLAVHGWAPPSADKTPSDSARDAVERDLDLYAPAGTPGSHKDLWVIEGVPYSQSGHVEDYTKGPWQWAAGLRINLKRVEG